VQACRRKHLQPDTFIQEMNMANFQWDDPFQLDQQLTEDERMIRDARATARTS
jgi:hypothetical protein